MRVVFLSGKGGAGKSMLASSLAVEMAKEMNIIAVDADVDAPDMAIWLNVDHHRVIRELWLGERIRIKRKVKEKPKAVDECPHNALEWRDGEINYKQYLCEGCGLCSIINPDIFERVRVKNGEIREYTTAYGFKLIEGKLMAGFTGSGKVVEEVIKEGEKRKERIMIIDGAAGIGCPVNAALRNADFVVGVVEETKSGLADFLRLLPVIEHFQKPFSIIINKHGLNEGVGKEIERIGRVIGRIDYDESILRCAAQRRPASECSKSVRNVVEKLKEEVKKLISWRL